jgi:hypothetical protein
MTDTLVTTGEQVAETLHRLGYLIGEHDLPAPAEMHIRTYAGVQADVALGVLPKLERWAEAADAEVTEDHHGGGWLHVACTVLGDVPLRMTAFGEALTPCLSRRTG